MEMEMLLLIIEMQMLQRGGKVALIGERLMFLLPP